MSKHNFPNVPAGAPGLAKFQEKLKQLDKKDRNITARKNDKRRKAALQHALSQIESVDALEHAVVCALEYRETMKRDFGVQGKLTTKTFLGGKRKKETRKRRTRRKGRATRKH